MSKASQLIVLCEDALHGTFVHRFLRKCGVPERTIRIIPFPAGKGCGEQHVRTKYPEEIKAYRARRAKTVLIVIVDADSDTVDNRQLQLERAAQSAGVAPRSDGEFIVHLIPRRHIETWLAFLDGNDAVNETTDFKSQYAFRKKPSDSHPLIGKFTEMFRQRQQPLNCPPSLNKALDELECLRETLQGT